MRRFASFYLGPYWIIVTLCPGQGFLSGPRVNCPRIRVADSQELEVDVVDGRFGLDGNSSSCLGGPSVVGYRKNIGLIRIDANLKSAFLVGLRFAAKSIDSRDLRASLHWTAMSAAGRPSA